MGETTSLQSTRMQFRTIDGLSIRFAETGAAGFAAVPLQLGSPLKDWVEATDLRPYRGKGRRTARR